MHCGDTLLFDADIIVPDIQIDPSATPNLHLWIVVTEPQPPDYQCVIVSVTTQKRNSDPTVILRPGDHPFVTRDSVIQYVDARFADARGLDELIEKRLAKVRDRCLPELLERIQAGIGISRFVSKKFVTFCNERLKPAK
jgi:mRNA-degrading endonuclease toxin of MazEF toxin-antitoxin module